MAIDRVAEDIATVAEATAVTTTRSGVSGATQEAIRRRDSTFRRALAFADCTAAALAVVVGTLALGDDSLNVESLLALPLVILAAKVFGLYDRDENRLHKSTLDEIPALFNLATLAALLFWLSGPLIVNGTLGQRQILGMWVLFFAGVIVTRSFARVVSRRLVTTERCLVVGHRDQIDELRRKFEASEAIKARVVLWIPIDESDEGVDHLGLPALLDEVEAHRVVIAPGPGGTEELLEAIREVKSRGVKVSVLPGVSQIVGASVERDQLDGITLLGVRRFDMTHSSRVLKRWFDVIASALLIGLLSPLLIAVAIAIKLSSPGSVLFSQTRIGRNGEPFQILKFRTMVTGADERKADLLHLNEADGLFKLSEDPRVTRVGGWLRRTGVDELPQLFNVLRGEMSLVGPRPLIPEEDALVEGWQRRRLELAPGITGYWQALGSSRIPLRDMVMLDFLYVADWSVWSDVRILLRTVPYVIGRRGR